MRGCYRLLRCGNAARGRNITLPAERIIKVLENFDLNRDVFARNADIDSFYIFRFTVFSALLRAENVCDIFIFSERKIVEVAVVVIVKIVFFLRSESESIHA